MGYKLKEAEKWDIIPEDVILEAEVVKVKEQDSFFFIDPDDESKGKKPEVSFRFRITDDSEYVNEDGEMVNFVNRQLFGRTPTTFSNHPDCKLRVWVQEILGLDSLPVDFELEQDEDDKSFPILEGMPVKVVVSHYQPKGNNADGTPKPPKEQVSDVMRISGYASASNTF